MRNDQINYRKVLADESIGDFVDCFYMLENSIGTEKEVIIMPNANFDLVISKDKNGSFLIHLLGLNTQYSKINVDADIKMFSISFKLLAVEYLFNRPIAHLINKFEKLQNGFWGLGETDLEDFDKFCTKANQIIKQLIPDHIDTRKQALINLIYATNGEMSIHKYSEKSFWSCRQINRYFTKYFGISLKKYCIFIRFRQSLLQIKKGELFPELNFSDQPHFSREIKKISGVNPRELCRNYNDRFIQVSLLDDD